MDYRRDIDGLRAIAILSVVIFHLFPSILPGGFSGVDIFFVISGYLITSIVSKGIKNDQFSFSHFYAKRITRLLPSLFLMFGAVLAVGHFILLPDEYVNFGNHLLSGSIFISNFTLLRDIGYFSLDSEYKPLLHLWSLGIEEQFYLILPLLILIGQKLHKSIVFVGALLLISFLLNLIYVQSSPDQAFYLPQTRIWELLIGSVLALTQGRPLLIFKINRNILSAMGIILCVFSFYLMDSQSIFPGYWALLPTIGASLVILSGPQSTPNKFILSNRYSVFLGQISYPLYLFHWPAISFGHILFKENFSILQKSIAIGMSLFLAVISYVFVEKKIHRLSISSKIALSKKLTFVLILFAIIGYGIKNSFIKPRSHQDHILHTTNAISDWNYPGQSTVAYIDQFKIREVKTGKVYTILAGDSNAEQFYPRYEYLRSINKKELNSLLVISRGGCPPIPGVTSSKLQKTDCSKLTKSVEAALTKYQVKNVVFAASWIAYFSEGNQFTYGEAPLVPGKKSYTLAFEQFSKYLSNLKRAGVNIILVQNIPFGTELDPRRMIKRNLSLNSITIESEALDKKQFLDKYQYIYDSIEKLGKQLDIKVINPLNYLCNNQTCPSLEENGKPIYKDIDHVRATYVAEKVYFMDEVFE
jgi:peptidoglycan/LPS O-acetylase OafA/YrhL